MDLCDCVDWHADVDCKRTFPLGSLWLTGLFHGALLTGVAIAAMMRVSATSVSCS